MSRKIGTLLAMGMLFGASGCATEPTEHEITPHAHEYPFTEVMGDYHVRLVVDHSEGEMFLLFEDIREELVAISGLERIEGEALLPDGERKREVFLPEDPLTHRFIHKHHRHMMARLASCYMAQAEWLKTVSAFDLTIKIPFEGRLHELIYHYARPKT